MEELAVQTAAPIVPTIKLDMDIDNYRDPKLTLVGDKEWVSAAMLGVRAWAAQHGQSVEVKYHGDKLLVWTWSNN